MVDSFIVALISFIIGFICGYRYLRSIVNDYKYRIVVNGKEHLYKAHKTVVEKWTDGLAVWECIDLKEI